MNVKSWWNSNSHYGFRTFVSIVVFALSLIFSLHWPSPFGFMTRTALALGAVIIPFFVLPLEIRNWVSEDAGILVRRIISSLKKISSKLTIQ